VKNTNKNNIGVVDHLKKQRSRGISRIRLFIQHQNDCLLWDVQTLVINYTHNKLQIPLGVTVMRLENIRIDTLQRKHNCEKLLLVM